MIALPPGVGAIDFYIDLAIDCVNTTNVTRPCQARQPPLTFPSCLSACRVALPAQTGKTSWFDQLLMSCQREYPQMTEKSPIELTSAMSCPTCPTH